MTEVYQKVAVFYFIFCFETTLGQDERPCSTIQLKDTTYQSFREGDYELQSDVCSSRVVYRSDSGYYLFFIALDSYDGWAIGPELCVNRIGLTVDDSALYPEDISRSWEEYDGATFITTNAQVSCKGASGLSGLAIAGIVIGSVLGFILLVCFIGVICKSCSGGKCGNCCNDNEVEPLNQCPSHMQHYQPSYMHREPPPSYTQTVSTIHVGPQPASYRQFVISNQNSSQHTSNHRFVYGRRDNSLTPAGEVEEAETAMDALPTAPPPAYEDALQHNIYSGPDTDTVAGRLQRTRDILSPPPAYEPTSTGHR